MVYDYDYVEIGTKFTSTQVASVKITAGGNETTYSYTYDANGNILSVSDGANTTSYVYDSLNQLTRENNQAANKTYVWVYDNGGNILSKTEYAYTTGELGEAASTVTYGYNDANWGDLMTSYTQQPLGEITITHDEIGNPLSTGVREYTWNGRQLTSTADAATKWDFQYDSDGLRTSRTNGNVTYKYVYSGSTLVQMTFGANGENVLFFGYDGSTPVTVTYNGTTYYYVTNLQGDIVAILDGSGTVVVEYVYNAWGDILSITGSQATPLGNYNPLRYRGYVYDRECNLYYLQSRYYDPSIGRFLNADAFASTGQGILGYNMFPYCLNNPVNHTDKTGMTSDSYAGWVGEQIGELIYEWITGNDHPSHQTRELEIRVRQKQNEQIGKGFKSIGGGVKSIWDAYMRGYAREQDAMLRQAQMNLDRFDSPEDIEKSIDVIEATGGFATAAYGVAYVTILSPASPIVVAVAIGGLIWAGRGLIREVL